MEQNISNLSVSLGDATHLPQIQDETYDIVLVFGPMYHLPHDQREKVILESRRICKDGGLILILLTSKNRCLLAGVH